MSAKFKKKSKTSQGIPTASLPDIIFMLLIFFMVTTVLRETELKVQTSVPSARAIEKIEQKRLVQFIYIGPERLETGGLGEPAVQIDDDIVRNLNDIRNVIYARMIAEPRTIVSMRVDRSVETGLLYDVQQELRESEALRVNYSTARLAE
ncbi:MAG: ExbD/TolR family protein [Rubricoccaceae bacterium]